MKKMYFYLMSMLVAAIVAVGCTQDSTTDEESAITDNVIKEFMTVTASLECEDSNNDSETARTTLVDDNGGKIEWSADDAIGAISADGTVTKCTIVEANGTEATFSVPTDTKYAVYPYVSGTTFDTSGKTINYTLPNTRAVDGSKKIFGNNENVMIAHLLENNLSFRNLCGYIEIKLKGTGTVKHVALRNNAKAWDALSGLGTVNISDAEEPKITTGNDHGKTFNFAYATCSNVTLSTSEATSFYFIVPPRTYKNLSICVQTDKGSYSVLSKNAITVNRSKIRPIAAINIDNLKPVTVTNLSSKGVSNCYVVPQGSEAKYFSFPARKINGTANLEKVAYAHLVWSEGEQLVGDVCYDAATGNVTFKYEGNNAEGNALISVMDSSNATIWSWHIWCTDRPEMIKVQKPGATQMYGILDRNVGATYAPKTPEMAAAISADDATASLGLYYQYGRPTPFPRGINIKNANTESTAFGVDAKFAVQYAFRSYAQDFRASTNANTYENALKYPNLFLVVSFSDKTGATVSSSRTYYHTWYKAPYNAFSEGDKLWYSTKTDVVDKKADNDPCPAGYVVDEGIAATGYLTPNVYTKVAYDSTNAYGYYWQCPAVGGLVWIPASGFRNEYGKLSYVGKNFNLWMVPTYADNGQLTVYRITGLNSSSKPYYENYTRQGYGFNVRCRVMDRSNLQGVAVTTGFEGQGTEASPYLLKNSSDLVKLAGLCNGSMIASGATEYVGAHYALTTDIDMSGVTFSPINNFSGTLDGKDYTISNLQVTPVSGQPNALFSEVDNATIKNLNLVRYYLNVTTNDLYAAGFAGKATDSTISNCNFNGTVMSACSMAFTSPRGTNNASAVIGAIVAYPINTTISNCNISGTIEASKGQFTGGVAGQIEGGKIENCNVARGTYLFSTMNHTAGIVGCMTLDAEIINCTVDTPVICGYATNGGIAGLMQSGIIRNCLVTSNSEIVGHKNQAGVSYLNTGGIVGQVRTVANLGSKAIIENCACYANVTANSQIGGIVSDVAPAAANYNIEITNCLFKGTLEAKSKNTYSWGMAGGIVGSIGNGSGINGNAYVTNCVALVDGINFGATDSNAGFGGVAGYVKKSVFNNCYTNLNVANIKDPNGNAITAALQNFGSLYGRGHWGTSYGSPTMSNTYYLAGSKIGYNVGTAALTNVSALTTTQMTDGTLLGKLQAVGGTWTTNAAGYPVPSGVKADTGSASSTVAKTRVSLIGDSISTFTGWIHSGYNSYYPKGTVTSATQTYWYKLIYNYMSNAELDTNIAWTGTVVARSTDENYLATDHGSGHCFVERFRDDGMGNPDVILLHGGTNDCGNRGKSIALYPGYPTYGGTGYSQSACPTEAEVRSICESAAALTTRAQLEALNDTTFVEAYVKLLCMMHEQYPNAKVVMIIGDKIHAGTSQAIQYIANYYESKWGYKCVNLLDAACGAIGKLSGDNTHPDEAGFETMASYIYQKVGDYID